MKKLSNIKNDFPFFSNNPEFTYLDSGASTQKPKVMLDAVYDFYAKNYSNIGRSSNKIAVKATEEYENARSFISKYLNAKTEGVVFTSGNTDSLNKVSLMMHDFLKPHDEIIICEADHNSVTLPFLEMAKKLKLRVKTIAPTLPKHITFESFEASLSDKTKFIAFTHVSNVLGSIAPVEEIVKECKKRGIIVLIDGAQSVGHIDVDIKKIDADFYTVSGHKVYGPTGIGLLVISDHILEKLKPAYYGGSMVSDVTENFIPIISMAPHCFEAGTPPIAQAIGLRHSLEYISKHPSTHDEKHLVSKLISQLKKIDEVVIVSDHASSSLVSFYVKDINSDDLGYMLSSKNICVRTGSHCAQKLAGLLNATTIRASFGVYNDESDVDNFVEALKYSIAKLKN